MAVLPRGIPGGFDPEVQWLANRGYAVLQVNFRGSTGYGKDFMLKGTGNGAARCSRTSPMP